MDNILRFSYETLLQLPFVWNCDPKFPLIKVPTIRYTKLKANKFLSPVLREIVIDGTTKFMKFGFGQIYAVQLRLPELSPTRNQKPTRWGGWGPVPTMLHCHYLNHSAFTWQKHTGCVAECQQTLCINHKFCLLVPLCSSECNVNI